MDRVRSRGQLFLIRPKTFRSRPLLEALEDRTLLSRTPFADLGSLTLDTQAHNSDRILVRFRTTDTEANPATGTLQGQELGLVPGLRSVHLAEGVSVESALASYRADPAVLYAHPDYRVQIQLTPNDPQFSSQWALNNTGLFGGTADADIDATEAWDSTTGNGTTIVAVIDTGVDYTHPDLADNIWTNPGEVPGNGLDDDGNGYVDDVHGYDFVNNDGDPLDDHFHGTHVAGTIGAVGNNGLGVAGVSWDVQIMALKFLDAYGGGYLSDAVRAIDYAVANGAHLSNNSWGGGGFEPALQDAIFRAGQAGHIFVAAAGNESNNNDQFPAYPASYNLDNIISVAATDRNDALAGFSNYGANAVDLAAPGVDILSTFPTYLTEAMYFNGFSTNYATISGTSMAAPHVAGVVALVRDQHPGWSAQQIINQVLTTVDPIPGLANRTATGGRLNAANAVGSPAPDTTGPRVTASNPTGSTTAPVSSVRLTFSEAVTGFDLADIVSFTGPGGPLTVTGVSEVGGSGSRKFDVTFGAQGALGDYSLVIGPDIRDGAGNPMDQDRDGNLGEPSDDQYTATFTLSDILEFPSEDVPAPIFDYSITISYLTIDQDVTIADLDVRLDLHHTYDGDLYLHLVSPTGIDIPLSYYNGGAGDHYLNTVFDDEAAIPINQGSAPFAGSYRPEAPLSQLDGQSARGTWQLWIEDWGFYDQGTLNAWALRITPGNGGPPPAGNNPPDAVEDYYSTAEDTSITLAVLDNDTDPDGDSLTVVSIDWVQGGTASLNSNGTISFTPAQDFYGDAGLMYTISDGRDGTDSAWVAIAVQPVNDAPVAADDKVSGFMNTPIWFDWYSGNPPPSANDYDPDGDWIWITGVANAAHGTVELGTDGTVLFTPEVGYIGPASFEYTITDGILSDTGRVDIDLAGTYLLSLTTNGTLTGTDGATVSFRDADILQLTLGAQQYGYSLYFDGSDVGLTTASEDIDAFTVLPDGSLLISTVGSYSVASDAGTFSGGGEDILLFVPYSLGEYTSGSWTHYFDGSDVGLSGSAENVDTVTVLSDGTLLISTAGNFSVPGVSGGDADLLAFTPSSLGNVTSGVWSLFFDGSDVGLSNGGGEDIDALFVREEPDELPTLHFSMRGNWNVPGVSGANEDLVAFRPTSLGLNTTGTYGPGLAFDGSLYGLAALDLDGIHLGLPNPTGPIPTPIPAPPPPPIPLGIGSVSTANARSESSASSFRPTAPAGDRTRSVAPISVVQPATEHRPGPARQRLRRQRRIRALRRLGHSIRVLS